MQALENTPYYFKIFQDEKTVKTGTINCKHNISYEGPLVAGRRHGLGTLKYFDGTIFIGMFANDRRNGAGEYTFMDGSTYACIFMDDLQHGKARYVYPDGSCVIGSFSEINENMLARTKQAAQRAKL